MRERIATAVASAAYLAAILSTAGQRRHAVRWLRSRRGHFLLEAPSPWLTFDAIERIRARMTDGMRIFEYGSGGSTLFWLKWRIDLCSVEHDPEWHEVVKGKLPPNARIDYRLIPPEPHGQPDPRTDPADPLAYVSSDDRYRGMGFRRYASQIDEFPDRHFDLVLVDGRARPSCILHAAPKVKPGGLLVLDNADRDYYVARLGDTLRSFAREGHFGVGPRDALMWRTDLYVKA